MSLGRIPGIPLAGQDLKRIAVASERRYAGLPERDASFASLLTKVGRSSVHADADSVQPSRLSKEELVRFLRGKQTEMDLELVRRLGEDGEGHETPADEISVFAADIPERSNGNEASKYQQHVPKSDGVPSSQELAGIIRQASETYGVDQELIRAVIKVESNFQVTSTSPKGAMGLMQLIPATASDMGVADPYDPVQNIMGGTRYLKGLLNRYQGSIPQALAAYNWGAGNVERHPDALPRETRDYIRRVTEHYHTAKVSV